MAIAVILILAPFAYLAISSVSPSVDLITRPLRWIPSHLTFTRYADLLTGNTSDGSAVELRAALFNSLIVAGASTVIAMTLGTVAAYGFARLRFPGRNWLILAFMTSYMLPQVALFLPLYRIVEAAHLYNTRLALIIIYSATATPFVIWLMRSYISAIPSELDDAALVDGCSRLRVLWRVVLPVALPGLLSTALLAFLWNWDEFMYALTLTATPAAETLPVALNDLIGRYGVDWGMMSTGGIIAALPPVLLAFIFQRYIVAGLVAGSVKG